MEKNVLKLRERLLKGNIDSEGFRDDFFPFEITWFVTLNCNLKCPYCFLPNNINPQLFSSKLDPIKVLKRCQEKGVFKINVLGGEPFLCKDLIITLARNCDKFGVVYRSTSTNGIIYDEKVVEALKNLKFKHILQVTLDGARPKSHFLMRKNKRFDLVCKNIVRYVKQDLCVMLGMTLTKYNVGEIEDFACLAGKLGAEMISYGSMMSLGRGRSVKDWHLSFAEMKQAYKRVKSLKTPLQIVLPNDIYGRTCGAGVGQASMLPNGDLYPCNMLIEMSEAKIGNFFDSKLNKYNNPWFIKLSAYKVPKKCDECELPPICDCACKAITYDHFRDFLEHKPFCQLTDSM